MKEKVGRYDFMAEPFHCDFVERLFMGHLGNHLINAADFHSNDRGFGMLYLNTIHKTWVLSRLAIELNEMPKAYDHFQVETWVESAMRFFTNRNFRISAPAGEKEERGERKEERGERKVYGYGRSVWAMIDTETRQPADLFAVNDGALTNYVVGTDGSAEGVDCPIDKPSRVKVTDAARLVRVVPTAYSDIDMNGHVNSIKYIEHALDLWDSNWYREHPLRRMDIAYVAEAHLGDELCFFMEESGEWREESGERRKEFAVRIAKRSPAAEEPEETCRCSVVFG